MTTTIAQTFTTTDGKTFNTRKDASDHQAFINRVAKVNEVIEKADDALASYSLAEQIAYMADDLIVALNNPLNRGRKAPVAA